MNNKLCIRSLLATGLSLFVSAQVMAAPVIVDLTGNIVAATGDAAPYLNTTATAHLVFDLDENNALSKETISLPGEPVFTRWTFSGYGEHTVAPYNQTSFSGDFGLFDNPHFVDVETLDNLDAGSIGNPFGLTGTVDVLSIFASKDNLECTTVDPNTGACTDHTASALDSEQYGVHFVGGSDWFDGIDVLPSSLLSINDLIGVFGDVDIETAGSTSATAEVTYSGFTESDGAIATPLPATVGLTLAGLFGLRAFRRA